MVAVEGVDVLREGKSVPVVARYGRGRVLPPDKVLALSIRET
jgi:hypothetical protein